MNRSTERLVLEPIEARHADDLYRIHSDTQVAEWYGTWTFEQVQERANSCEAAWRDDGVHKWMAYDRETHELIGRGGLSRLKPGFVENTWDGAEDLIGVLEIGWIVLGKFWGHGYATEIGREGLSFAFNELRDDRVIAFTESHNKRSRAVMDRLKMRFTGEHMQQGMPFAFYEISR